MKPKSMSLARIEEHAEACNGYCAACRKVTNYGGVEPDAHGYECERCGEKKVMGIEDAVLMGFIMVRGGSE